jgi:(p)ppGpp synthase/HD superfamily hydrolase
MNTGYSDRINHAFAFAAKHHDQAVRRGTRLPYATHPANVAVILTRYAQSDDVVVGGILHNVIAYYVSDGFSRDKLEERIGDKFGASVLSTVLCIVERRVDADGVELSQQERKSDLLSRLAEAGEESLWICAADKLHQCGTLLADLRRTEFPEMVWERLQNGKEQTLTWHRAVHERFIEIEFNAPIVSELGGVIEVLSGS